MEKLDERKKVTPAYRKARKNRNKPEKEQGVIMEGVLDFSLSISDDDMCSECKHLSYNPGKLSLCWQVSPTGEWPGKFDEDGYCISCASFLKVEKPGDNWVREES